MAGASRLSARCVTAGGWRLHTRFAEGQAGHDRLPVVLVHGMSVSSRYLISTAEQLAEDYYVYAPDLPGFGKSEKPPYVPDIAELAGVLAAWMDVMGLERAVLVGNSYGCCPTGGWWSSRMPPMW